MDNSYELTPEEAERPLTPEEEAQLIKEQKKFLYGMEKDEDTGAVKLFPMNGDDFITLHSEEEARFFINCLLDYYRKE